MSRKFSVLGSPIEHSLSPAIHLAAYRVLGEDWQYQKMEVEQDELAELLDTSADSISGFSLTMPLKEEAFRLADSHDGVSLKTGAVNTLVREKNQWIGYNTDVFGITQSLAAAAVSQCKSVVILGSGATAISAITAISQSFPNATVLVYARNRARVTGAIKFARSLGLRAKKIYFLQSKLNSCDLAISTMPSGVLDTRANQLAAMRKFNPRGVLLDVAYAPWPSEIAKLWISKKLLVISGLEMLLWQAIAQIRIFKSGSPTIALENEQGVMQAMRRATQE